VYLAALGLRQLLITWSGCIVCSSLAGDQRVRVS